jgi:hypothetical protein
LDLDSKQTTYVYVQALVWDVKSGEKLFTIEGHKFDIDGLVFTRDDSLFTDRQRRHDDQVLGHEDRAGNTNNQFAVGSSQ